MQLLEAHDDNLTMNIRSSPILVSAIKNLVAPTPDGTPRPPPEEEYDDDEDGEGEISSLAKRILELTGDRDLPLDSRGVVNGGVDDATLRQSVQQAFKPGDSK